MPDLVVIGHVTCDVIDGNERLGGAASYVSLTAARLGMSVTTVTAAPASFSLLGELSREPRISVERQDSAAVTRFALDYSGPLRRMRLLEQASVITRPKATAQFVYLAPVIGEVPYAALAWFPGSAVVIGLQGWMRDAAPDGSMRPIDPPEARLLSSASAVCFSEHDHPEPERLAAALAKYVPVVVVTRGMRGATLYDVGGV
jgi:1D-myo-inositol 3-kinase